MSRGRWTALIGLLLFCALSSQALGQTLSLLDESGAPASVYVEKTRVYVQVTDPAANVSAGQDTVEARLSTALGGDVELVTLTETGASTGVFRGDIALDKKGSSPQPGVLETDVLHDPPYGRDTIGADYGNGLATATASLVGSATLLLDGYGHPAASFAIGETIFIRVVAPLRNDPNYREDFYIPVSAGSDQISVDLRETGVDTGVFEGSVDTSGGSPILGNNVLETAPGQMVQATVADLDNPTSSQASATLAASGVELIDAQGKPATFYLESSRAYVRVRDFAADLNPSVRDTTTVQMTADLSGDQETVTLQETGTSTGIFEGSVPLRRGPGVPGNGSLETTATSSAPYRFDTLHAAHADGAGNSADAADMLGSLTFFLDGYGNEVAAYPEGSRVYLRVEDHNFNDSSRFDTTAATVQSPGSGDAETMTLVETGRDTGIFEGSIPTRTSSSGSGDGVLTAQAGQTILAQHVDANNVLASGAQASVQACDIHFIEATGEPTVELVEDGRARVRVTEPAANVNPSGAETVTVHLQALYSQDQEDLTLTETGPDTGVFEGSTRLNNALSGIPYNGILDTGYDFSQGPVHLDQVTATFAGASVTARMIGSRVWFIDDYGRVTTSFPAGGNVGVRLEEPAANNPGSWDQIYNFEIDVRDGYLTSSYYLNLNETGVDTGIFEGYIPSTAVSNSLYVIRAAPGLPLQAISWAGSAPSLVTANAVFTGGQVLFVDAQGQPADVFLESTRTYVRVVDPGANHSAGAAESVTVQLTTAVWDDQESLTLQETGLDTGVFEGSIPMRTVGTTVSNGILETGVENGPPVRYDTLTASYTDSGGMPETATASTLGYRVWFLDAAGNVVTSYVPGARAYIRLEDHDFNDPSRNDILYVELHSSNGDQEFLEVDETGLSTGIYEGSIPLESAAATTEDGRLQAAAGGQISADRLGPWFPAPVYAQIESSSIQIVDAAGQPVSEVLENGTVHVRVNHPEANTNPGAVETVSAQIQSLHAGDQETITLTETGPDTGLFEGSIPLRYNFSTSFDDGFLETQPGFGPSASEEITAIYGAHSATAHTVLAHMTFVGLRDQPVTSYALRSLIRLKVEDRIDNNPGQIDTLNVVMSSIDTSDQEPITLTETGPDTGVFYGSIPSLETSGSSFDGVLWVGAGQTATARFNSFAGQFEAQVPFNSNYVPVVQNELLQTEQGVPVYAAVLSNDYDPEGGTISLAALSQGAKGAVTVDPYGYVTYTPNSGTFGTDTFTYVVADEQGGEALGTVTVIVNGAPVASDDSASVDEGGSVVIPVLANDSDPENDSLRVVDIPVAPAHGTATINPDQTVTYVPEAGFHGVDSFEYSIFDAYSASASATVTVTVNAVNDPPVANNDSAILSEDSNFVINLLGNDSDPDGDPLYVASVTQPAQGTVVINPDQTVTYTPPPNFYGQVTFTYTAADGNGGTATATVTAYVLPVNDPPVANADTATVAEDGTANIAVLANDTDVENDTLSLLSVTQGAHGAVVINPDKTVKYTPAANYNGSDSFTYTASDGNGGTATGTVTITVTSVNDAPVANADSATVAEDDTVSVSVLANDTDADGDTLSVSAVTQGAHGTVAINPDKTVKYTPAANYNGSDSFTYTVSDGNGGTAAGTVTITVTSVNDAPAANADSATVAEDGTVDVAVLTNDTDPEGDTLSVASVTQGVHGTVAINPDKTVKYTPTANYNGSDSFTYTVSDGNGGTATVTVTITVTSVNDAPVANADSATVAEDGTVNVAVLGNDTDVDGDTLSVSAVTQGTHGTVAINPDKTVKYTPAANYNGSDSFTYTVSDGNGGTATGTVTITVTSVNDAPVANADSATVTEDGTVNVAVLGNDTDPEGDTLSVSAVTQGTHGTVAINPDKTVRYAPAANYNGSDSFTYTVSDGNGGSATGMVVINVTPVNDPPVAVNDSTSVATGSAVTVSVLANDADVDGPGLLVTAVTQGAHGSVVINADQAVTYTAAQYVGSDSFTYTVSDGAGGTATATVSVTITAPPRITLGLQAQYDFNEGSGSTVNDTSGVGTPLNLTIASPSSVTWISGGLRVNTATAISSSGFASKIISAVQASNEITVEAWVSPSSLTLTGPARIATIFKNASQRNLVFGQSGSRYETQLKTSAGTASLQSPASSLTQALTHVVYTRSSSGTAVWYINGAQVLTQTTTGNLSTWGTDQKLTLSDNWQGSYYLLAVYGRALTSGEVQQNYLAGVN